MRKSEAINEILKYSKLEENALDSLLWIVANWEFFQKLRKEYPDKGLLCACWKELGVKFMGMYHLNSLEAAIQCAKNGSLI